MTALPLQASLCSLSPAARGKYNKMETKNIVSFSQEYSPKTAKVMVKISTQCVTPALPHSPNQCQNNSQIWNSKQTCLLCPNWHKQADISDIFFSCCKEVREIIVYKWEYKGLFTFVVEDEICRCSDAWLTSFTQRLANSWMLILNVFTPSAVRRPPLRR